MSSKHTAHKVNVRKILFAATTALTIGAAGVAEANKGAPLYGMPARPGTGAHQAPLYGMPARGHSKVNPIGNPGPLPPGLGSPVPGAATHHHHAPRAPLYGMPARPVGKR